ncbi:pilus assembly PilX family protein [Pseudidiomarina sp. E22-M8]|uniref:pilus assembly PilX family protein n=1 Tax=Pseudidiomarina sp. E22-M8 TaxID=3424768 RepID=UPI00403C7150
MYLNLSHSQPREKGAALAIALFVLLVMSLVGLTLVRSLNDTASAVASDVLGTRAQLAATSSIQAIMVELYPLDTNFDDSVCPARTSNDPPVVRNYNYTAPGLTQCTAQIRCNQLDLSDPYNGSHIRIIAEGSCEGGTMVYSKRILVEVADAIK